MTLKKTTIFMVILVMFFSLGVSFSEDNTENVDIEVITFSVNINGESIDNMHSDYPLISYKDITYFPMTWDFSQSLGLETSWSAANGLSIKSISTRAQLKQSLNSNNENVQLKMASKPRFKITIDGMDIDNSTEMYPILVYRDITYFPLTWKFAVETFGWDYNWSNEKGLEISAMGNNNSSEQNGTQNPETETENTPISVFTDEDIELLGLSINENATDKEKADAIYNWQHNNIIFADSTQSYNDAADAMRFNYYFGDIYTTKNMIEQMKDGDKWYGICYNYATLFKSIGEYYGLEVKVENTVLKPSETLDFSAGNNTLIPPGMSTEEYSRLNELLTQKGLDYPYEAVRLISTETPTHYRAVVKIDNEWQIYDDVSDITKSGAVLAKYEFKDINWQEGMQLEKLNGYIERIKNGETLKGEGYGSTFEEFQTARNLVLETGEADGYIGITDDLGQQNRAETIDDFMQGKGLIPYLNTYEQVQDFLMLDAQSDEDKEDVMAVKNAYEENTGQHFYMVADVMIYGDDDDVADETYAVMYESYVGERLNLSVFKYINSLD
jgi:hypothetical protein